MRGYHHPIDPSLPLEKESAKYHTVATVTISGHVAAATLTKGDLSDLGMWADIDAVLRGKNVTELHYDRHKNGESFHKIRYIRDNKGRNKS